MVDKQDEQVPASAMAEERAAAARVAAISVRRSEMAREALALQQQLTIIARDADAVVAEALDDLILTANQVRVPDNTQAAVSCPTTHRRRCRGRRSRPFLQIAPPLWASIDGRWRR